MNEDDLRRSAERGRRATALLENPLLIEAFDKVDTECVRLWREAKHPDAREGFWLRLQSLKHVRTAIEAIAKDGDLSRRKLEQMLTGKKTVF